MFPALTILSDSSSYAEPDGYGYPCWTEYVVSSSPESFNVMRLTEVYHWHHELEFVIYVKGGNTATVNGKEVFVKEGQAILVNSRRMHHYRLPENELHFIALRIHPSIFIQQTPLGASYYERKFGAHAPDYMVFDPDVEWQKQVIDGLYEIHAKMQDIALRPLPVLAEIITVLDIIGEHMEENEQKKRTVADYSGFYHIAAYIRKNYSEKISISDLMAAGHISRARVFQLFEKYTGMPPMAYVMKYRVERGEQFLINTNLSVSEIAELCGFATSSHFARVFRREKGVTPSEYRMGKR